MRDQLDPEHQRLKLKTALGVALCLILEMLLVILICSLRPVETGVALSGTANGSSTGDSSGTAGGSSSGGDALVDQDGGDGMNVETAPTEVDDGEDDAPQTAASTEVETPEEMPPMVGEARDVPETEEVVERTRERARAEVGFSLNPNQQAAASAPVGVESEIPEGMFENRTAESRREIAEKEGGSPESEAAVERGLVWLANHQGPEGQWSLSQFNQHGDCDRSCKRTGTQSDTAGTALGVLPFLGAGYTHQSGQYRKVVNDGLNWLIKDMNKDGSFNSIGGGTMYAHGQASIALCEAYAMTRDKKLRDPATAAIGFIAKSQHTGGGWRYSPNSAGDTSVTGWQILALKSAGDAKLRIPRGVSRGTNVFLDSVQADKLGAGYSYTPGGPRTTVMTAEGLLCRMYSGWNRERQGIKIGTESLLQEMPRAHRSFYYWYYATQVMHHYGGEPWEKWNPEIRDHLIETQATEGHETGSWKPVGGHDSSGGRLYATSLALLTLEVYYRHKRLYDDE